MPVLVVICAVLIACGGDEKTAEAKAKDKYEQTKESLEESEKKNPKRFLSVVETDKKNLVGKTVIRLEITNKATVATYKDIDVEISFYSKTGSLLERDRETIHESVAPGSTLDHKTKYRAPKDTDRVEVKIMGAKT